MQVTFDVVLLEGLTDAASISAAICQQARECGAFAVVVSSHKQNMLQKLFYGSVCDSVVQNCNAPVAVLH